MRIFVESRLNVTPRVLQAAGVIEIHGRWAGNAPSTGWQLLGGESGDV
jgi:hypothetical protein